MVILYRVAFIDIFVRELSMAVEVMSLQTRQIMINHSLPGKLQLIMHYLLYLFSHEDKGATTIKTN